MEDVEFDEDEQLLVASVRPHARGRGRCGRCGRRAPAYDRGEGRRRWRALDLGTVQGVIYQIFMPSFVLEHAVDSHSEVKE